MNIQVGLRFNRSSGKFWISGIDEENKNEFNKFIEFYQTVNASISRKMIEMDLHPQNDSEVEECFKSLKPILTDMLNIEVGTKIEFVETEIVNEWFKW